MTDTRTAPAAREVPPALRQPAWSGDPVVRGSRSGPAQAVELIERTHWR